MQRIAWTLAFRLGALASLALPLGVFMVVLTCQEGCLFESSPFMEDDLYLFDAPVALVGGIGLVVALVARRHLGSLAPEPARGPLAHPPSHLAFTSLACGTAAIVLAWTSFAGAVPALAFTAVVLALAAGLTAILSVCWPTQTRRAAVVCGLAVLVALFAGGLATLAVAWLELSGL